MIFGYILTSTENYNMKIYLGVQNQTPSDKEGSAIGPLVQIKYNQVYQIIQSMISKQKEATTSALLMRGATSCIIINLNSKKELRSVCNDTKGIL